MPTTSIASQSRPARPGQPFSSACAAHAMGYRWRRRAPAGRLAVALLLSVSTLAGLAGCGGTSGGSNEPKLSASAKAVQSALKSLEQTTTAGVRVGEGRAPIDMRFAIPTLPAPGQPFTLVVSLLANEGMPSLKVEVPALDGVTPGKAGAPLSYERVERGTVLTIPLEFTVQKNGIYLFKILATEASPTGAESVVYTFPVVVGPKDVAAEVASAAAAANPVPPQGATNAPPPAPGTAPTTSSR